MNMVIGGRRPSSTRSSWASWAYNLVLYANARCGRGDGMAKGLSTLRDDKQVLESSGPHPLLSASAWGKPGWDALEKIPGWPSAHSSRNEIAQGSRLPFRYNGWRYLVLVPRVLEGRGPSQYLHHRCGTRAAAGWQAIGQNNPSAWRAMQ